MNKVVLLDVGHGNCSIVHSAEMTAVIDCPIGSLLLDTLHDMEITIVSAAFISHADKDHIAGILSLLTSDRVHVQRVYVNPDSQRRTRIWNDFRVAVAVAERNGGCEVITSLSTTMPGTIELGGATITVVSPSAALALTGVGGRTRDDKEVTANTLSGVLRIDVGGRGMGVLLAGDMDDISLDQALAAGVDLSANVLVFPHHGGLPGGSDPAAFARKLLDAVKPRSVIFSNGKGRHDNPRPEIIAPVREWGCTIACTQLSERCQAAAVDNTGYLESVRAYGRRSGACCAGSVSLTIDPEACRIPEAEELHRRFVSSEVKTPMCRI